jgi:hypothetical protein
MDGNGQPPIDAGGAGIDPASEKDRGAIRRAAARWPKRFRGIDDEKKARWLASLDMAENVARQVIQEGGQRFTLGRGEGTAEVIDTPLEAAKVLISVVKTGALFEGMNQSDDHKDAELDVREKHPLGTGGNTYIHNTVNVESIRARILADPAAHRAMLEFVEKLDGLADAPAPALPTHANGNGNGLHRPGDPGNGQP